MPPYITSNPRFSVDCADSYGTGLSTLYSLDGSRYVPGRDSAHLGGDVWTADAALEVMAREDWAGLFLTFGGIDKVAHMLGEQDGAGLRSVASEYRLADVAAVADEQLGRVLDALKSRNLLERTLVVVTADHGGHPRADIVALLASRITRQRSPAKTVRVATGQREFHNTIVRRAIYGTGWDGTIRVVARANDSLTVFREH